MKIHQQLRCLAGATLVIAAATTTTHAQSWETVDVFQVPTKRWNQARSVAVDSLGRLFVAGYGYDDGSLAKTLVMRRSLDRGASWQSVLTLNDNYPDGADHFKVLSGTGGQVFVVAGIGNGNWQGGPDAMHWLV